MNTLVIEVTDNKYFDDLLTKCAVKVNISAYNVKFSGIECL